MITIYGMNEKVGNVSFYDPQQEYTFQKPYSEETAKLIDEEVRGLIERAYIRTKQLLSEKRNELENLAQELLEKEILFQQDLERLIGKRPYEMKHPHEIPVNENGEAKVEVEAEKKTNGEEPALVNGDEKKIS